MSLGNLEFRFMAIITRSTLTRSDKSIWVISMEECNYLVIYSYWNYQKVRKN